MKKICKKRLAFLLLCLCLLLSACSRPAAEPEETDDIAGSDWRTWGIIDDYDTIIRDGEEIDVCICYQDDDAIFYYDDAEQVVFDQVVYPMTILDSADLSPVIFMEDLDEDGNSDVRLVLAPEEGDALQLVWIWDPVDGYVFQYDLSSTVFLQQEEGFLPYFEDHQLPISGHAADGESYLLENGLAAFLPDGSGFSLGDCYWQLTVDRDESHDGLRELDFTATCYIPPESFPDFGGEEFNFHTSSELYDYYSGVWLTTASSAYGDTSMDENHYMHTIYWNDASYDIEFFYETRYEPDDVGGYFFYKTYHVYMTEGYDGLVFAAQPMPYSYEETEQRYSLEEYCPEYPILDCETVDAYSCLLLQLD